VLEPVVAPIHLEMDRERRCATVHIPEVGDIEAEPIKNPVTGEEHRAKILDQQAQQDMINRAKSDARFGAAIPGTFGKQLDWDPNWELRWMNFSFTAGRVVTIWHATYRLDWAYRLTIFWDPDTNNWAPWVQAQ
jgi:hypothetical protein